MAKKGRFVFDERPAKDKELARLIKLSKLYQPQMKQLFTKLKDNNFKKIIDIGAGTGHTSILLKKIFPEAEVTYCDRSKKLLEYAQNLAREENVELNFINKDILDSNNSVDKYDFVFCRYALKHIFSPELAIKNMVNLLKRGGIIQLIDKDVSANIWFPRFPLYKSNYMKALNSYNAQKSRGGDATIGRKLPYLLRKSDIKRIETEVVGRNLVEKDNKKYQEIMIEVYKNLLPELIEKGYIIEDKAYQDIKKLDDFLNTDGNLAIIFDFIVTGVK